MTDEQKPQQSAPGGGESAPAAETPAPAPAPAASPAPAARPEGGPPPRREGGGGGGQRHGGGRPGGFGGGGRGREGGGGGGRGREGGGGGQGPRKGKRSFFRKRKVCRFCAERADHIDYKNADPLRGFVQERGKVLPRRITGTCSRHQRWLITAIKRARNIALLPFASEL